MLRKHKNHLFNTLQELGFDPAEFETEIDTNGAFRISVKAHKTLYFSVRNRYDNFDEFQYDYVQFAPIYKYWSNESYPTGVNLEGLESRFRRWLEESVKIYIEEVSLPDLWAQLENQKALVTTSSIEYQDTNPFTEEEKIQVRLAIQEFRMLVQKEFQPAPEELTLINGRLDYLTTAAERLNHFDWKALAASTLVSIAITLSLDTNKGHILYNLFQQALRSISHFLQ